MPLAVGTAGLATLGLLRVVDPTSADSPLPPCPVHALTGVYCPGCGATRALHALAHADLGAAWAMNPLLVLALPLLALMLLRVATRDDGAPVARWERALGPHSWLVVLVAYTIARNLPWPPFSALAPG